MTPAASIPLTPTELFRDYAGYVRSVLRGQCIPASELDDLVQEVFVVLHRKRPRFESSRAARSWLFRTARGVGNNARRRFLRAEVRKDRAWSPVGLDTPDDWVARRDGSAMLRGFLSSLSPTHRRVFVLSEIEGRSAPEISHRLGSNLNTVYASIRRLRSRFNSQRALFLLAVLLLSILALAPTCDRSYGPEVRTLTVAPSAAGRVPVRGHLVRGGGHERAAVREHSRAHS